MLREGLLCLAEPLLGTRFWSIYQRRGRKETADAREVICRLLDHAMKTVPLWSSRVVPDLQTTPAMDFAAKWREVPITTKDDLRRGFPEQVTSASSKTDWRFGSSAGTVDRITVVSDFKKRDYIRAVNLGMVRSVLGNPLAARIVEIPPDACNVVCALRDEGPLELFPFLGWALRKGILFHRETKPDIRGRIERSLIFRQDTLEPLPVKSFDAMGTELDNHLDRINKSRANILRGLPVFLLWMAERARQQNRTFPSLKAVMPYGGLMSDSMAHRVTSAFRVPFVDYYGTSEVGGIAMGSPRDQASNDPMQNGLKVFDDLFLVEVLDEHNQPLPPDVVGKIVITDFNNYAMPLIRYEVGDFGKWLPGSTDSNDQFLLSRNGRLQILGRRVEMLPLPGEKWVSARDVMDIVFADPSVLNANLERRTDGSKATLTTAGQNALQPSTLEQLKNMLNVNSMTHRHVGYLRAGEQREVYYFQVQVMLKLADRVRPSYPIFSKCVSEKKLIYLDSAATALKPQCVIDAVVQVMEEKTANIHRSVHHLGDLATEAYENSRQVVADFIGAQPHEIVFLRNTTEALNLIARGWKRSGRVLVSLSEHHSNLLAWEGEVTRLKPTQNGMLDLNQVKKELAIGNVALVSATHVSNVTGLKNDIETLCQMCHEHGVLVVVDAAQSVPHQPIDVVDLDCDFLTFSGHKLGSPTGVGVLYGKAEYLEKIDWHLRGGATVEEVHAEHLVPKDIPWRFEAGTPAVESVVGLAAAIDFLQSIGWEGIIQHQELLLQHAISQIQKKLPRVSILGGLESPRLSLVSMVQRVVSPHVLARSLSDSLGVCVRSGFHCAQPLHEFLKVPASLRLSFYLYNTKEETEVTIDALARLLSLGI